MVYRIDAADTIVAVNEAWRDFARENGAAALADSAVGRQLWEYVDGASCRLVWQLLLESAREGRPVAVTYRCDSPDLRRHLELTIRALGGGELELASRALAIEPRPPVELLAAGHGRRDGEQVASCSLCRRFFVDGWVEAEVAAERLRLLERPTPPVVHVVCPGCEARVLAGLPVA